MDSEHILPEPVIAAVFDFPTKAHTATAILESNGIRCQSRDVLTVESYHFISQAVGGIKVFVNRDDYEEARRILLEGGFISELEKKQSRLESLMETDKFRKAGKTVIFLLLLIVLAVIVVLLAS